MPNQTVFWFGINEYKTMDKGQHDTRASQLPLIQFTHKKVRR